MKKFYFYLFVLIFSSSVSYSQVSWYPQYSGTFENLNGIFLVDASTHYAVGNNGVVLKTTNSGQNWTMKNFPSSTHNLCVFFENALTGFVGNQNANVYKTVDGGNNWEVNGSASTYPITSIFMPSTTVGYCSDRYANIQKSTDNGQTWWTLTTTPGWDAKIFFINENRGWSVDSYGYLYSTSNAGYNWSSVRISTDTLSSVYFITSTIGFVAGDSGRVFKTTNGGTNWTLLNTGTTVKLRSIYVENLNIIYACGDYGRILYSFNGGTNWTIQTFGSNNFNNMHFIPNTLSGCIAGNLGTIYKSYSSGNSCVGSPVTSVGYPFFTSYMDSRTDMLFTAGELLSSGVLPGQIIKIGFNFSYVSSQPMNGFNVKFQQTSVSSLTGFINTGWTTGFSGTYTVPGTGTQYINMTPPYFTWDGVSNLLVEICFNNSTYLSNSDVQASSINNMVYHNHLNLNTGNGCTDITTGSVQSFRPVTCFNIQLINSINNNNNIIPEKYFLSQNYPNPFNPITKIKYGLPKQSYVSLKIYDLLGREIKTLVNEQMQAGEYILDFNGSDLPSGTYFYRIEAGNYTETKKLILLK